MTDDRKVRLTLPTTANTNVLNGAIDPGTPIEYSGDWSAEALLRLAVMTYPVKVQRRPMTEVEIEVEMRRLMRSARAESKPFPIVSDIVIEASIWLKGGETIYQGSRVETGEQLLADLWECQ